MLIDNSGSRNTKVLSQGSDRQAFPFNDTLKDRKIVMTNRINTLLFMGGSNSDHFRFEVEWNASFETTRQVLQHHVQGLAKSAVQPGLSTQLSALQIEILEICLLVPPPGKAGRRIRYLKGVMLGDGGYGDVYRALNVETGDEMAVKVVRPAGNWAHMDDAITGLKAEAAMLQAFAHVC